MPKRWEWRERLNPIEDNNVAAQMEWLKLFQKIEASPNWTFALFLYIRRND